MPEVLGFNVGRQSPKSLSDFFAKKAFFNIGIKYHQRRATTNFLTGGGGGGPKLTILSVEKNIFIKRRTEQISVTKRIKEGVWGRSSKLPEPWRSGGESEFCDFLEKLALSEPLGSQFCSFLEPFQRT